MSGGQLQLRFLILLSLISLSANPSLAAQTRHKARTKAAPIAATPAPPPTPLTPAQMPATPPTVSFVGEQLTVNAPNSTLGDILREVRKQTGASIDIPGNATERVMGIFGPGPARDVLTAILNGSHFNYVLMGSATNPSGLDRVMLLSKPAAEPVNQVANAQMQNAPPQAPPGGVQAGEALDFGNDQAQGDNQQDSADIFGSAEEQQQPDQNQQADDQQGVANPFGNPNANQVKTPQQLLQELQQQQQQGQQNPNGLPNPGNPRFGGPGFPGSQPQPNPQ
ncbi:MAG TPA: hypothetical protein VMB18_09595 [Terriglobales bacterium]|nr:hypothetical protein [Terriglobales bacterium]